MPNSTPHFFALSNDVFDALYSSRSKYPDTRLRRYAIKRGLILSNLLDREELCIRIAGLPFSYNDFKELSETVRKTSKKPGSQSKNINQNITTAQVQNIIGKFKEKNINNDIKMKAHDNGVTTITVDYSEFDHGQTRIKQRVAKKSKIEIIPSEDGTGKIISSANTHTQEMVASLLSVLEEEEKVKIETDDIDLSDFTPTEVNKFFIDLVNSIPDLGFSQAVSVKLQKSNMNYDDEIDGAQRDAEEFTLLSTINSASMSGGNILQSPQIMTFLADDEYYIHTLRWETDEVFFPEVSGALLYIEIKITPPLERTNFNFDVLSYRKRNKNDGSFSKSTETMRSTYKKPFIESLQKRAYSLYKEIKNEVPVE